MAIAESVGFSAALLNCRAISLWSDRWLAMGQDDFPEAGQAAAAIPVF